MPKEFLELKEKIENLAQQGVDVASSSEIGDVKSLLESETSAIKEQTSTLKDDAERNKAFNKLQIAADAYQYLTKERDDVAWRKEQKQVADVQKKHNRGAKDAREIILYQNKLILEKLTELQRAGFFGGGGTGGGGSNLPVPSGGPNLPALPGKTVEGQIVETSKNIQKLGDDIRKTGRGEQLLLEGPEGKQYPRVMSTRNKAQYRTSMGAATLQRNLDNLPPELQNQILDNKEFNDDFKNMTKEMDKLIRGDKKGNRAKVLEGLEAMKLSGGEDLTKALGLDDVKGQVKKGEGNLFGGLARDFLGVNQGTDLFSGKALKEMFSADRIFGKASKKEDTSWYNMSRYATMQGDNQFAEGAQLQKEIGAQVGKDTTGKDKFASWMDKWIPEEYKQADSVEKAQEAAGTGPAEPLSKREKIVQGRTGQDRESEIEILKEIRDTLKNMAQGGGFGMGGFAPPPGGGGGGLGDMAGDAASMAAGSYAYDKFKNRGKTPGGKYPKGRLGLLARGKDMLAGGFNKVKGLGGRLTTGAVGLGSKFMGSASGLAARVGLGAAPMLGAVGTPLAIGAGIASAGYGLYRGAQEFGQTDEFNRMEGEDVSFGMKSASAFGGLLSGMTFGLTDADSISKGVYGKTTRDQLDAIEAKDPELANIIQAKIDGGMTAEEALDSERASIRDAGIDERGFFTKMTSFGKGTMEDMFTTSRQEAAMDSAKESGLYKKTIFGESVVDETMLGNASIEQLKAIAEDDDLSDQQMQRVQKAIENRRLTMGDDQGEGFADTFTAAGSFVDTTRGSGEMSLSAQQYDSRQDALYQDAYKEGMGDRIQGPPAPRPEEDHAGPTGGIDDRNFERSFAVGTMVYDRAEDGTVYAQGPSGERIKARGMNTSDGLGGGHPEMLDRYNEYTGINMKYGFSLAQVGERDPEAAQEYNKRVEELTQERIKKERELNPNRPMHFDHGTRLFAEQDMQGIMLKEGKLLESDFRGTASTADGTKITPAEALMRKSDLKAEIESRNWETGELIAKAIDPDAPFNFPDASAFEKQTSPTGTALDRLGNLFEDAKQAISGFFGIPTPPPPPPPMGAAPDLKGVVATMQTPGVRDNSSTIGRYNDRRFS